MTDQKRRRETTIGPIGPWAAIITVDAVQTVHGRQTTLPQDWLFEVGAEWTGPPPVGFPPSPGRPVSARDVVMLDGALEDALRLAREIADAFREGGDQAPDLRDFVEREGDAWVRRET